MLALKHENIENKYTNKSSVIKSLAIKKNDDN